jgi:23S rRNA pseudouridine1911/1915/1917 synthase
MTPDRAGPLLPYLLAALAPMNRTRVKQLLTHGRIHVNGKAITKHDHVVRPGDQVTVDRTPPRPAPLLPIVYEDESLVVIDKPEGLLTVATETEKVVTAFRLLEANMPSRPAVVHRLDRETSGLLLFAKSQAIREQFQLTWDRVEKTYLAVVAGTPKPDTGVIDNYLTEGKSLRVTASAQMKPEAKRAVSRYRTVKSGKDFSLVEIVIETGRKHQIRVHMSGLGHPVIGDKVYGSTQNPARRLGLHAHRLTFDHPVTGKRITVESPLPASLSRIV